MLLAQFESIFMIVDRLSSSISNTVRPNAVLRARNTRNFTDSAQVAHREVGIAEMHDQHTTLFTLVFLPMISA